MLLESHFIAFNTDIKSKDFLNALKNSSLHVISHIRQPNDQDLFRSTWAQILHERKFCRRPASEKKSVSWSKVASRLRLNVCWCTLEVCKYKKRNHNGGHEDILLKCNVGCKKHTADLALMASIFSQAFLQENLRANGNFYPKYKLH